jgi:C1A family cysteine protease
MAMREMYDHKISAYYRITLEGQERVNSVIEALRGNRPVVYGTIVGDNWFNYQAHEVLRLPASGQGGHATHLVGWDNSRAVFIGENSWGTAWGDDGYYLIAPEVIADHPDEISTFFRSRCDRARRSDWEHIMCYTATAAAIATA